MNAWSAAHRGVARRPVLAFMLVSLGVGFLAAAVPPIIQSDILPFGLPLHGVVMSLGRGPRCVPGYGCVVGASWCCRPRTSECALAGQRPLVSDSAVDDSG